MSNLTKQVITKITICPAELRRIIHNYLKNSPEVTEEILNKRMTLKFNPVGTGGTEAVATFE